MTKSKYRYLLDTNIVSELIKKPQGFIAKKMFDAKLEKYCCTTIIVACELRYGAVKKKSPKLSFNVEQVLNSLPILPLEKAVDEIYAKIRVDLESRGLPIGHYDLLIAAHALLLNLTVITANEKEFSRVKNLKMENWLNDN
jgi:tRNA(fMet)-specific endonuclease VapC